MIGQRLIFTAVLIVVCGAVFGHGTADARQGRCPRYNQCQNNCQASWLFSCHDPNQRYNNESYNLYNSAGFKPWEPYGHTPYLTPSQPGPQTTPSNPIVPQQVPGPTTAPAAPSAPAK